MKTKEKEKEKESDSIRVGSVNTVRREKTLYKLMMMSAVRRETTLYKLMINCLICALCEMTIRTEDKSSYMMAFTRLHLSHKQNVHDNTREILKSDNSPPFFFF
jgi:hypothetical protein